MRFAPVAVFALLLATLAHAQAPALQPPLAGIGFLLGHWSTPTAGKVAETGGGSTGSMDFTPEVGGAAILRKDHVSLFDQAGKPAGAFDIIMLIYPESGAIHADYSDGTHIIHYTHADVTPGQSVTFLTASSPVAPTFKLGYVMTGPKTLTIDFEMAPPGSTQFHPIATGSAKKDSGVS